MKSRSLTVGEEELARSVFLNSINYSTVQIHDHRYVRFQPGNSGMTPNGHIYIRGGALADYSQGTTNERAFFIHEMVHVWQKQNGVLNPVFAATGELIRHKGNYSRAYVFQLNAAKDLLDYRIEQQAEIIEYYYRVYFENEPPTRPLNLLHKVIKNFEIDPSYPRTGIPNRPGINLLDPRRRPAPKHGGGSRTVVT